jgi:hypothetical protein
MRGTNAAADPAITADPAVRNIMSGTVAIVVVPELVSCRPCG